MKKLIIGVIPFFVILNIVNAQTIKDVTYFNYSLFPKANFDAKNGNAAINKFEFNFSTPPIQIGKKLKLINSVYYKNSQLAYSSDFPERDVFPTTIHDVRYNAAMLLQLKKNWEILGIFDAALRSDFKQSLSGKDFFPTGILGLVHSVKGNEKFKIGGGIIAVTSDFERNAALPFFILLYESKKMKVELLYPRANIIYKYSPNFEFGLFSMVEGAISRVSPFTFNNETTNYFRTFEWVVAPSVSHRVYKSIFAHLKIGYSPVRNIELLNNVFEPLKNQDYKLQSSLYLRAGFSLRIAN
jgi:Domain of unknown function (DUF6268)